MNDWSRLAVDPKDDAKNSEPKSQLQEYKYAPDQAVLGTCYQEAWAKRTLRREKWRGQLRLSLTNTYHEWPVKEALGFGYWTLIANWLSLNREKWAEIEHCSERREAEHRDSCRVRHHYHRGV